MKKFLIFLFLILLVSGGSAQFKQKAANSGIGVPFFEAELFRTFTLDGKGNHIILYSEILYDDLTFVKATDGNYLARIELVIAVFDSIEKQVYSKSYTEKIIEENFDLTNSREKKIILTDNFDLPRGEYEVKLQTNDLTTNKTVNRKIKLNLTDIANKSLVFSDILLLEEIEMDSSGNITNIEPRIQNNFPGRIGFFYIYFDIYSKELPKDVEIHYQFITRDDEVELDSVVVGHLKKQVTGFYLKIHKNKLQKNRYNIVLNIGKDDNKIERKKQISFYWITAPSTSDDIHLALRQMRYITNEDSLDKYLEADLEDQIKYFKRFWARRDPNPDTEVNELMEEYFKRVNYANREFSTFKDNGWLTDRGRIMIKFGFPDDIENHPFELSSNPYVIWRYYTLRKIFVFLDRTGFGDYQLLQDYYDQEWR